jgi:hypothetical protein
MYVGWGRALIATGPDARSPDWPHEHAGALPQLQRAVNDPIACVSRWAGGAAVQVWKPTAPWRGPRQALSPAQSAKFSERGASSSKLLGLDAGADSSLGGTVRPEPRRPLFNQVAVESAAPGAPEDQLAP